MVTSVVAALLLMLGAVLVAPAPASADFVPLATCQNLHLCLYSGAAYTGSLTRYGVPGGTGGTACRSLSGDTMNNNVESMVNGSPRFIQFYNSTNCSGSILGWLHAVNGPTDERSSLPGWANVISSFRYCPSSSPAC